MSGRFTRLSYDPDAYNERLQRSTQPLNYMLDQNYANNCTPCFSRYGPRNGREASVVVGDMTDVDSILKGISKINTKSSRYQQPMPVYNYPVSVTSDCNDFLETEYTRHTNPAYNIRGLTTKDMNFGYPLYDPQCNIFENSAVNTRLLAKDNHKAKWFEPLNQRDCFPTEKVGRDKNCVTSIHCTYAPVDF